MCTMCIYIHAHNVCACMYIARGMPPQKTLGYKKTGPPSGGMERTAHGHKGQGGRRIEEGGRGLTTKNDI